MQIWCFERGEGEEEHVKCVESALDRAALIQNYHNPSLHISILEARTIMSDLTEDLKHLKHFKHRRSLSKEEEIKYYETAILQAQQYRPHSDEQFLRNQLHHRLQQSSKDKDKEKIDSLEQKINRVDNAVYQLIGGLFNQKTQSDMIDLHLCGLSGVKYRGKIDQDTIWPTTRQGDQHEEEIKLLKQQVSKLEDTVALLIRIIKEIDCNSLYFIYNFLFINKN